MDNLESSASHLKQQALHTLYSWGKAVEAQNSKALLELYDDSATLKPTLSKKIRTNKKEILSYFIGGSEFNDSGFLKQDILRVQFLESHFQINTNTVTIVGKYRFIKKDSQVIQANYTFVFQKKENELKIIAHHSSIDS